MQRSGSSSIEPTSRHFVANLGALDPAAEERLQRWAATSCDVKWAKGPVCGMSGRMMHVMHAHHACLSH